MSFIFHGIRIVPALAFLFMLLAFAFAQAQWKYTSEVSPQDIGYINTLASYHGLIFAGTDKGGVFRSPDTGGQWIQVDSGLAEHAVFSLAVSGPFLVAGTYTGVFRSLDNGETWAKAKSGLENERVWKIVRGDSILIAGTSGGVFRSFDDGATWTLVTGSSSPASVSDLAMAGSRLVAVVPQSIPASASEGIYGSADNGASWVHFVTSSIDLECLAAGGSDFFAGYSSNRGVRRSSDGGESWVTINNGLLNSSIHSLAADAVRLFAGTYEGSVFISLDRGATWKDTGLPTRMEVHHLLITEDALWAAVGAEVMNLPISEATSISGTKKSLLKENRARIIGGGQGSGFGFGFLNAQNPFPNRYDANGRLQSERIMEIPVTERIRSN